MGRLPYCATAGNAPGQAGAALSVALSGSAADARPRAVLWTPEEARRWLTELRQERSAKDGPLFSPVTYSAGARPGNGGVLTVNAFAVDADHGGFTLALRDRRQWEQHAYSTHSSTPERPRGRIVFPLAEPVLAQAWPATYRALCAATAPDLAGPSCSDPARIYYLPSCPPGRRKPALAWYRPGPQLRAPRVPDLATQGRRARHPRVVPMQPAPPGGGDLATLDEVGWFAAHGQYGRPLSDGRGREASVYAQGGQDAPEAHRAVAVRASRHGPRRTAGQRAECRGAVRLAGAEVAAVHRQAAAGCAARRGEDDGGVAGRSKRPEG